jgi:hypothetical protein
VGEPKQGDASKPFDISKGEVWRAYQKVKGNKGAPGVDKVSLGEFEKDLKNQLYQIWNRMSSDGSTAHAWWSALPTSTPQNTSYPSVLFLELSDNPVPPGSTVAGRPGTRAGSHVTSRPSFGRVSISIPGPLAHPRVGK